MRRHASTPCVTVPNPPPTSRERAEREHHHLPLRRAWPRSSSRASTSWPTPGTASRRWPGSTRPPWELVAVDNGSADGTADYLTGVRDAAPFPVTVVTNAREPRFPGRLQPGAAPPAATTSSCSTTSGGHRRLARPARRPGRLRPEDRHDRADVQLRLAAPAGRARPVRRPRRHAPVRRPVAGGAPGTMAHRPRSSRGSAC